MVCGLGNFCQQTIVYQNNNHLGLYIMANKLKVGAAALTLAVLMSGCAPTPATNAQTGATTGGDYGASSYGGTTTGADYGYNTAGTTAPAGGTTPASYYDYGTSGAATGGTAATSGYGGATTGTSGSYYDYTAPGGASTGGSGSYSNTAGGSYAVQVVASQSSSTAEAMRGQMQSMGFNAVVDHVGGFYKVRVPFSSESEAKSSLGRIRSSVPDAFYTVR
jgi:hypothetical protein